MTDTSSTINREAALRAAISNAYYDARNNGQTMEQAADDAAAAVLAIVGNVQPINVIFDGPPAHESGRFVEVELDDGRSIRAGEWTQRPDGLWSLHIVALPAAEVSA